MVGRRCLSSAARTLRPLQQGSLDSMCGLYAVINAVQLALYPHRRLTRPELLQLFGAGLDALRRSRSLSTVLVTGMPPPLWRRSVPRCWPRQQPSPNTGSSSCRSSDFLQTVADRKKGRVAFAAASRAERAFDLERGYLIWL